MPPSPRPLRERRCRVTVYGPTVPMGPTDRAACLIQGAPQDNTPPGLDYQSTAQYVRGYSLYRMGGRPRWLDLGAGARVYLSPSLFVVDPEGVTRALPLVSDRWAVSADGSRAAFAFGSYDDTDHEFTAAWGYINCKVEVWDVPAAARVTSVELEAVPVAVAFAGENVLIQCRYGANQVLEPGGILRDPTPDECALPIPGPARAEEKPDWSDLQMPVPGGGRIPVIQPSVSTALPVDGRLFVLGRHGGQSPEWPLKNVPFWLNDQGSAPVPATPEEWTAVIGVDLTTVPLIWSPSATCFVTGPEEERRVVERGTGRTLFTPPSRWVQAITDDGVRAVVSLEEREGDAVVERDAIVSRDGGALPLKKSRYPKFAFSRAGDRLFASDELNPESETPCRCYDARTGEVLWETSLPLGPRALTGGAVWSRDDREVLVGVQARGGGLLVLRGKDGAIRSWVSLGDVLPYVLAAPGDATIIRAEGLFLAVQ